MIVSPEVRSGAAFRSELVERRASPRFARAHWQRSRAPRH